MIPRSYTVQHEALALESTPANILHARALDERTGSNTYLKQAQRLHSVLFGRVQDGPSTGTVVSGCRSSSVNGFKVKSGQ